MFITITYTIYLLLAAILEAILHYRGMQGLPSWQTRIFTRYCGQNLLFYRDMASKDYNDFSLPVKQTPHQVVTLGCPILICSCSYLIVKLKLYHFIALSTTTCYYIYKHTVLYAQNKKKKIIEDHFSCRQLSLIPS